FIAPSKLYDLCAGALIPCLICNGRKKASNRRLAILFLLATLQWSPGQRRTLCAASFWQNAQSFTGSNGPSSRYMVKAHKAVTRPLDSSNRKVCRVPERDTNVAPGLKRRGGLDCVGGGVGGGGSDHSRASRCASAICWGG